MGNTTLVVNGYPLGAAISDIGRAIAKMGPEHSLEIAFKGDEAGAYIVCKITAPGLVVLKKGALLADAIRSVCQAAAEYGAFDADFDRARTGLTARVCDE